jgi:hypothetical protein
MNCDFCLKPATWIYPADSFFVLGAHSESDWAACDACKPLIDSGDRDALAERALVNPNAKTLMAAVGRAGALAEIRSMHRLFFQHKKGGARPIL